MSKYSSNLVRPQRKSRAKIRLKSCNEEIFGVGPQRTLELHGVLKILENNTNFHGGINCDLCGKLYKSKVCFTKHIWEHSIYWDSFHGSRNQDRVLAIQAALILYNHYAHHHSANSTQKLLSDQLLNLLVTEPREHNETKRCRPFQPNEGDVKKKAEPASAAAQWEFVYESPRLNDQKKLVLFLY